MGNSNSNSNNRPSLFKRNRPQTTLLSRQNNNTKLLPNKPFTKRLKSPYKPQEQWTRAELQLKRDQFWDTAPKYDGRIEIWQALKYACESEDDSMAQAIIDGAGIVLPTGVLSDGAYDELGNRYQIPEYCFTDPVNLIQDGDGSSKSGKDQNETEKHQNERVNNDVKQSVTIMLRLSLGKDVRMEVNLHDNIANVKYQLVTRQPDLSSFSKLQFFYMGKLLDDKVIVKQIMPENLFSSSIVQVFCSLSM